MKILLSLVIGASLALAAVAQETKKAELPPCCRKEVASAAPLSDASIYQVQSTWTNDLANALQLPSLRGKPQIITMFFASCEFTCPILVNDMVAIESALPEELREKVGFTLVSFDTERDTPAVLAKYREQHRLDASRWTLLQGKEDDVLELAALIGMKFKKDVRGQFVHSNLITLLDAEGNIVKQESGFGRSQKEMVEAVQSLLNRVAAK